MKELIGSVIFFVSILGAGSVGLRHVLNKVERAAIEKVSRGLPSLTHLNAALRGERRHLPKHRKNNNNKKEQ